MKLKIPQRTILLKKRCEMKRSLNWVKQNISAREKNSEMNIFAAEKLPKLLKLLLIARIFLSRVFRKFNWNLILAQKMFGEL